MPGIGLHLCYERFCVGVTRVGNRRSYLFASLDRATHFGNRGSYLSRLWILILDPRLRVLGSEPILVEALVSVACCCTAITRRLLVVRILWWMYQGVSLLVGFEALVRSYVLSF